MALKIFSERDINPGPGAYNTSRDITHGQKPAYSLGKRLKTVSDSKNFITRSGNSV
jgi:hypothetical protein